MPGTRKHMTVGPFEPPFPSVVESSGPEPMAVAWDKQQTHGESFLATSAPMDAYDDEVARRYKQVPAREIMPKTRDAKCAAEHPPGYTEPDARGWVEPTEDPA